MNWLFLDLNSYFASVEQQERPELRGRPIAVVPCMAETTCCIAASYEAKARGVKTGTLVAEARLLCPEIEIVEARQKLYVEYHHAIKKAVETCVPITETVSIDEVACRLMGRNEQPVTAARALAQRVKQAIREQAGDTLSCSIGLAPNRLLAKVASNMQKPDGLTVLAPSGLPHSLYRLKPQDIPGIGWRMNQRLIARGVHTMEQLFALNEKQMRTLWGGMAGERIWLWLRGIDFTVSKSMHKSVGHQHVLPPELRTPEKAHAVGLRLLHKAATRLREFDLWARGISVTVGFKQNKRVPQKEGQWDVILRADSDSTRKDSHSQDDQGQNSGRQYAGWQYMAGWEAHTRIPECRDTSALQNYFNDLWDGFWHTPQAIGIQPKVVSVTLFDLIPSMQHTPSLFDADAARRERACEAMDSINRRYGKDTVYPGCIHSVREAAPTRIAFTSIPGLDEF